MMTILILNRKILLHKVVTKRRFTTLLLNVIIQRCYKMFPYNVATKDSHKMLLLNIVFSLFVQSSRAYKTLLLLKILYKILFLFLQASRAYKTLPSTFRKEDSPHPGTPEHVQNSRSFGPLSPRFDSFE
jgi:hypothetical protein